MYFSVRRKRERRYDSPLCRDWTWRLIHGDRAKAEEILRKEVREPTPFFVLFLFSMNESFLNSSRQREEREAREVLFIHQPDGSYSMSFDNEISSKRAEKETKEVRSASTLFCRLRPH